MRKLLAVIACLGLFAAVANANNTSLFYYFSLQGDLSGIPAEYTAGVNPTITCPGEYAYLWAVVQEGDVWNATSLAFDCNECLNQVGMSGVAYNPTWWGSYRWETTADFDPSDGKIGCVAVTRYGLGQPEDPSQFSRHYLIGEFDCLETCCPGDIYLRQTDALHALRGTTAPETDLIYFGFDGAGQPELAGDSETPNICSPTPDLYCVPEPASLLLLGFAGLFLRRR